MDDFNDKKRLSLIHHRRQIVISARFLSLSPHTPVSFRNNKTRRLVLDGIELGLESVEGAGGRLRGALGGGGEASDLVGELSRATLGGGLLGGALGVDAGESGGGGENLLAAAHGEELAGGRRGGLGHEVNL